MYLKQLKDYIENLPDNHITRCGLSNPFSWRGCYEYVAFAIVQKQSNKKELLTKINMAYQNIFEGYGGGEYKYNDNTPVEFEEKWAGYSNGEYAKNMIEKFIPIDRRTIEERLIEQVCL